jgi:LacI family gluconate utilization system Gnt-I transcriptional repressor
MQAGDARALERLRSFQAAVRGLLPDEPVRVLDSQTHAIDLETGKQLLDQSLRVHPETDVLMFSSDVFAAGALLECARRGINVPGDLAVTGFGDFEIARHIVPGLTTVSVPNREIGIRAGRVLLASMSDADTPAEDIDLGFSIVARESA